MVPSIQPPSKQNAVGAVVDVKAEALRKKAIAEKKKQEQLNTSLTCLLITVVVISIGFIVIAVIDPETPPDEPEETMAAALNYTFPNISSLTTAVDRYWYLYTTNTTNTYLEMGDWNVSAVTDFSDLFSSERNPLMVNFTGNISNWDVSNAMNMSFMFYGAESFATDISEWSTSNVMNMSHMFADAQSFNGTVRTWDVESVQDMTAMFSGADNFDDNLESWNVAGVQSMEGIFMNTKTFSGFGIQIWNVTATTSVTGMFCNATALNPFAVSEEEWSETDAYCSTNVSVTVKSSNV